MHEKADFSRYRKTRIFPFSGFLTKQYHPQVAKLYQICARRLPGIGIIYSITKNYIWMGFEKKLIFLKIAQNHSKIVSFAQWRRFWQITENAKFFIFTMLLKSKPWSEFIILSSTPYLPIIWLPIVSNTAGPITKNYILMGFEKKLVFWKSLKITLKLLVLHNEDGFGRLPRRKIIFFAMLNKSEP